MDFVNRLGDMEITDPKAMRALAHPVRLAVLERLQRHGPATASQLSPHVGATPSVTSWHLRHLAGFGLVRDAEGAADRRERRWEAVARGFRFHAPADAEGTAAARALSWEMFARAAELPERWATDTDTEPGLEPAWRRLAGLANTRIVVTAEELAAIEDAMEAVLAPYVMRDPAQRPPGSRGVRLLRYALPETGESAADATGEAATGATGEDASDAPGTRA
ncbi:helix-turn-helix transcriptional regulator [Streptomyces sp. TRM68367]|uniref:ArsR/SmtB family transcription factor n=1 Tax=Streptomyces sp. TRM68367 TaxID=2758415 RepID=UPI00165A6682|nr:helix-turn-helix domain-containing protein [Streptomyces sp. TRM68367]MBC9726568.1 helix-turn-helix transcriptional regulator [Streptomyces sp. TRM68367]